MNQTNKKTLTFHNPLTNGFQTFKKTIGFILLASSLYYIILIINSGIKLIDGQVNFRENNLIQEILPDLVAERTLFVSIPGPDKTTDVESKIVIPKTFFMIPALLLIIFIFGIIARLVIAILNAGVSLMKDDVSYVFERLRKEIENNKLPKKTDP